MLSELQKLALVPRQQEEPHSSVAALQDIGVSRLEIVQRASQDLDFFAAMILGEVYQYKFSDYHHALWHLLTTAALKSVGKPKYALGVPRGFAKTVLGKLFIAWLVLYTDHKFVLVVCNTATLAINFLADVADMLDTPNIKLVYGDWRLAMEKDTGDLKKFAFQGRNCILAALGSGSSLRGLNIKYERPSFILMDDMQNRDEAENPEIAKDLLVWMLGTLMKAANPKRCVYCFVGNMYPFEGSILRKLKHDPGWTSLITGAILADGTSLWPEHRSVEDLLEELRSDTDLGHPELFYAEVMNDEEAGTVSGIDVSKIPHPEETLQDWQAQAGYVIIDPSLGKKKSDDVAIGAFLVYDGKHICRELAVGKFNSEETIMESVRLCGKYGIPLIAVEAGGFQESLCFWFTRVFEKVGIEGIMVVTVTTGGMQKVARIKEMFKQLLSGYLMLHKTVRSQVIYQITQFNPLKPALNKDDILDVCAYSPKVWSENMHNCVLHLQAELLGETADAMHTENLALAF